MRALRILLVLWLAIVLQTVVSPAIAVFGIRPDFPLLVVLLVALHEGPAGGALAGFAAGLFVDLNSTQLLGSTSAANAILAFAVGSVSDRIVGDSRVAQAVVVLIAAVLRDLAMAVFLLPGGPGGAARHLFVAAVPGGLYSAVLSPLVLAAGERIVGWRGSGRGLS